MQVIRDFTTPHVNSADDDKNYHKLIQPNVSVINYTLISTSKYVFTLYRLQWLWNIFSTDFFKKIYLNIAGNT